METIPASALVVVAHADDCEYACGGTVARWTSAGSQVDLVVVTDGARGSHDPAADLEALRARRRDEQLKAARVLGLREVVFWDERDGELEATPELVDRVVAEIRGRRPEVVVTHDRWRLYEVHPDHVATGSITWLGAVRAREPLYGLGASTAWRPRSLLLFNPERANRAEDIAPTFERKLAALLCHRSQYVTAFGIEDGSGPDGVAGFTERVRAAAARAGAQHGLELAELFTELPL